MKIGKVDELKVCIFPTREEMGKAAAVDFAAAVREILKTKESVRVIFAAAPSQDDILRSIVADPDIDCSRIEAFHMDEYIGLDQDAPQGFGNFLKDRIFGKRQFRKVHYIDGQNPDPEAACRAYAAELAGGSVDIVVMGIGENGHIAFNDPAVADFRDPENVKIVELDEVCRMQQVHDGCFARIEDVPTHAVTLTVPCLMQARYHFCVVPAPTKAQAVYRMLHEEISEACPCTILRRDPRAVLYLDKDSSALLEDEA